MPILFAIAWILIVVAGAIGWIINLITVANLIIASAPVTALVLGRMLGVFVAPLGAVLGWL